MRPRLTRKVLRGLAELRESANRTAFTIASDSDVGAAMTWITRSLSWTASTKRPGKTPPQFLRRLQKKFRV